MHMLLPAHVLENRIERAAEKAVAWEEGRERACRVGRRGEAQGARGAQRDLGAGRQRAHGRLQPRDVPQHAGPAAAPPPPALCRRCGPLGSPPELCLTLSIGLAARPRTASALVAGAAARGAWTRACQRTRLARRASPARRRPGACGATGCCACHVMT